MTSYNQNNWIVEDHTPSRGKIYTYLPNEDVYVQYDFGLSGHSTVCDGGDTVTESSEDLDEALAIAEAHAAGHAVDHRLHNLYNDFLNEGAATLFVDWLTQKGVTPLFS